MSHAGFVVAMAADIAFASYERPAVIRRKIKQWMIVSRWGSDSEYLTISSAGTISDGCEHMPAGLVPRRTLLGVLLSEDGNGVGSTFLLVRHIPPDVTVAGTFFPADGYVSVGGRIEALRLKAEGRHSHSLGRRDRREIRKDVPDPAPNARATMAWHILAVRRPWSGEFIA